MPAIYSTMPDITDLAAGVAGEHLVCADLLLQGYRAFLTDQNCPYDVAVELESRLVRIQVKATRTHKPIPQRKNHTPAYIWQVRRAGKGGKRLYKNDEFDLLALVALDIRSIAYFAPSASIQTIHLRIHTIDHYPIQLALSQLDLFITPPQQLPLT